MSFSQLALSTTRGFNSAGVHEVTGDEYDVRGFDRHGINLNGTRYDARGFDFLGRYRNGGMYNERGFNALGVHCNWTAYDEAGIDDGITMMRFQLSQCPICEDHMCYCRREQLCNLTPQQGCGILGPDELCYCGRNPIISDIDLPTPEGSQLEAQCECGLAWVCTVGPRTIAEMAAKTASRVLAQRNEFSEYCYEGPAMGGGGGGGLDEDWRDRYDEDRDRYDDSDDDRDRYEDRDEDYHASFGCCGDHSGPFFCDCNANRDDY
jgi:hypothetical protein